MTMDYLYYKIIIIIDEEEYLYSRETNRNRAKEIALKIRKERGCETYIVGEVD